MEDVMITSAASAVLALWLVAIPSMVGSPKELNRQQDSSTPALSGIMRVRVVSDVPRAGVEAYLEEVLPELQTDGGEDDFVLTIRTYGAGGRGRPEIRRVEYYRCHVTVYRKLVVEGRQGKFVVYEDSQPENLLMPAVVGRDLVAEVALRGFISDWKAANREAGDGAETANTTNAAFRAIPHSPHPRHASRYPHPGQAIADGHGQKFLP
jgi:hypothetical protein